MNIKYLLVAVMLSLILLAACKQTAEPEQCINKNSYVENPNTGECVLFETNCPPPSWKECKPVIIIEEPGTKLDKDVCKTDDDCVCGGIDTITNQCFIGNKDYYNDYVDKSKTCPDFCGGIASNLVIRCIDDKCRQISKLQDQMSLCNKTGSGWLECGSGCGPLRVGDEIGKPRICPAVCIPQCKCPPKRPFWDDDKGCVSGSDAEISNACKSDEDCTLGIRINSCCDCPDAYALKKISYEASLVNYEYERDYSAEKTVDCKNVQCQPCPLLSEYVPKCLSATCQLVKKLLVDCETDADCGPNECCHPDKCVPVAEKPMDCEEVVCTMSCETPLDCGAGSCRCVSGECQVVMN